MNEESKGFVYQIKSEIFGKTSGMTETESENSALAIAEKQLEKIEGEGAVTILKRKNNNE